jgi:hypothetical protein
MCTCFFERSSTSYDAVFTLEFKDVGKTSAKEVELKGLSTLKRRFLASEKRFFS